MLQVFSGRVTWLSSLLTETTDAQLFAQSEHAPIKQNYSLNISNVQTIFRPPGPSCQFFMQFRGPEAHTNRIGRVEKPPA